MKKFRIYFAICTQKFPNVHYWGEGNGRTPHTKTANIVLFGSDGGVEDWLPQCYVDAVVSVSINGNTSKEIELTENLETGRIYGEFQDLLLL